MTRGSTRGGRRAGVRRRGGASPDGAAVELDAPEGADEPPGAPAAAGDPPAVEPADADAPEPAAGEPEPPWAGLLEAGTVAVGAGGGHNDA